MRRRRHGRRWRLYRRFNRNRMMTRLLIAIIIFLLIFILSDGRVWFFWFLPFFLFLPWGRRHREHWHDDEYDDETEDDDIYYV